MSYDQWKTASPYDDEIDFQEQSDKWQARHKHLSNLDHDSVDSTTKALIDAYWIIEALNQYIDDNV